MFRTNSPLINTILVVIFFIVAFGVIRIAMRVLGTLMGIAMPLLALGFVVYLIYTQCRRRY